MKIQQSPKSSTRKEELMAIALDLFDQYWYEKTSIQMIIQEWKVTKGAFYHYFPSKEAILEDVVNMNIQDTEKIIQKVVDNTKLNALEKMNTMFVDIQKWKIKNRTSRWKIKKIIHTHKNIEFEQKLIDSTSEHISPLLEKIFIQWKKEKILDIRYPKLLAKRFFSLMIALSNGLQKEDAKQCIEFIQDSLERLLGIATGSLQLIKNQ